MTAAVAGSLSLLSAAPDGIKALRQLVRDLAVGGRLLPELNADSWPVVQLVDLVQSFQNGVSSRGASDGVSVVVLRLADIKNGSVSLDDPRQLTLDEGSIEKYRLAIGDVLVIRVNGSADLVGRFVVCESSVGLPCDHFIRLRLDQTRIGAGYLKLVGDCTATRTKIQDLFVSTAGQKTVNQTHIGSLSFALPPLADQQRIVAKVDELMALCDRLEARQQDAEAAHARLVQALLDSLTQARDADEFQACWQRVAGQFGTLFVSEDSVAALRQAAIDCAASGQFRAGSVSTDWCDGCLGDLVVESSSGWSPSCEARQRADGEWGVLKVSAVSWGSFRPDENKALPESLTARPELEVRPGDFLISRANTAELVARSVFVEATPPRLMLSDKIVRLRFSDACEPRFAQLANSSTAARRYYAEVAGGTSSSMKNVTRAQILALPIKYPGLAEQRRIVAKVNELLALCDQLKSRIAAARAKHAQLAEALVAQAVAA